MLKQLTQFFFYTVLSCLILSGSVLAQPVSEQQVQSAPLSAVNAPILPNQSTDPLPSWKDGATKQAIVAFVKNVTDPHSARYVPVEERVATFDLDGTLWVEKPMYTQIVYAFNQITQLASQHPEWKEQYPYREILAGDQKTMTNLTADDFEKIVGATQSGMTVQVFKTQVQNWFATHKHPRWDRPYADLVYQPMLEVMQYLRANGFKTYIVSGSTQDFIRSFAADLFNIPVNQVIGTIADTEYKYDASGNPILIKSAKVVLDNNSSGKAKAINVLIGHPPLMSFGNSNGDRQMQEYTQSGDGDRLILFVYHDDAAREYDYGANSKIGTFSNELMAEAKRRGWMLISMKNDWKQVFSWNRQNS